MSSDSEPRCNLLVAFPYWSAETSRVVAAAGSRVRLLVDSGAFTAWKAGKVIALDDYCRFLEGLPVRPWRYFTLDVVGDPEGSLRNYETMLQRGLSPVPIFTRGEDPAALERYYKTSDVVGIGGLVRTQEAKGFVNGIMRRVAGRRVHLLGFTHLDYLKHYRPYMCDSSGWNQAPYGSVRLYMGGGVITYLRQKTTCRAPLPPAVADRVRRYGHDPLALRKIDAWRNDAKAGKWGLGYLLSIASAVALSLDVQRNLGTLLFNAVGNASEAGLFVEAFERHQAARA